MKFLYSPKPSPGATAKVTAGQGLWIWVNVGKGGTLSSPANTTLALSLDGAAPLKTLSLYPISPGRNYTAHYNWDTSGFNDTAPTAHSVRAEVDAAGQNNDSDRSNNALSANLTVIPPIAEADLAVTSVRTANPSARYEEVLMVTATVVNLGGRSARNFTVRFTYQSGSNPQLIGDQTVPSVLPGEQRGLPMSQERQVRRGGFAAVRCRTVTPDSRSRGKDVSSFGGAPLRCGKHSIGKRVTQGQ